MGRLLRISHCGSCFNRHICKAVWRYLEEWPWRSGTGPNQARLSGLTPQELATSIQAAHLVPWLLTLICSEPTPIRGRTGWTPLTQTPPNWWPAAHPGCRAALERNHTLTGCHKAWAAHGPGTPHSGSCGRHSPRPAGHTAPEPRYLLHL